MTILGRKWAPFFLLFVLVAKTRRYPTIKQLQLAEIFILQEMINFEKEIVRQLIKWVFQRVCSDFNKWVTKTHVSWKLRKIKFNFFNIKISKLTEYFLHDKNSQTHYILHFFTSLHTKFEKKSFISHDKKSFTSLNTATGLMMAVQIHWVIAGVRQHFLPTHKCIVLFEPFQVDFLG